MERTIIKCAINRKSGEAIHIDKADNGLKCGCYCTVCDKDFVAIQGKSVKHREWHFRHDGDKDNTSTCPGGGETALHKLAKQILTQSSTIELPKYGTIQYSDPTAEVKHFSTRPDVTATYKGQPAYFEVAVHHFIEPDKEEFFTSGQYRSVEINLRNLDPLASEIVIEEAVLRNIHNKRVIFWETEWAVVKPAVMVPQPIPFEAKPPVVASKPAIVLQHKEDIWDKIVRFVKERPVEAVVIIIASLYLIPKLFRWILRKIFWFLY